MNEANGNIALKQSSCIQWSIANLSDLKSTRDDNWSSPKFHLRGVPWVLRLYPTTHNARTDISLYLVKLNPVRKVRTFSIRFGIEVNKIRQYISINNTWKFNDSDDISNGGILLKRENGVLFLHDKNTEFPEAVTCFCDASFEEGGTVEVETQTSLQDGYSRLTRDLKELFLTEEGADVTIKVKDKEFRAHSQILSARSSVLAAMFRHDTKEKNTGVVEIPEFEPDAFREFLIFLYSGQTDKLSSDIDIDLYSAADKYDIEELKTICSEFMKENITVDSFCDVLSLAIRHGDKGLIDYLTDYFVKNVKKIIVTLKWMAFAKEHPTESNELVIKLAHHFVPD